MASDSEDFDEVLVPKEAARFLKQHEQTLYRWRAEGKGPAFVRTGRKVLYLRETLRRWLRENEGLGGGDAA